MIKKFKEFLLEKIGSYEYGCVMIDLPLNKWDKIVQTISPEDVYTESDNDSYGIQKNPHLTLLYGLHDNVTLEDVKSVFDLLQEGINIEIDGIGIFENKDYDVVKFNVKPSSTLQSLHNELSKLPNSNEYPDYKPHITICYVKKGTGKKYIRNDYRHSINGIKKICYSLSNGEKFYFEIG